MKKLRWLVFLLMVCASLLQAASPDTSQNNSPAVITKEALQDHLVELQQQREQAIATVNAISGAIQECEYWLEKLKEEKQEE